MTDDRPSERVVLQRIRNRIIEYLADFDVLTERFGPFEVINLWEDWVDDDRLPAYVGPVFTGDERAAIKLFHSSWDSAAEALPGPEPDPRTLAETPDWARLREAAEDSLQVFQRRGRLSEEHEIDDA